VAFKLAIVTPYEDVLDMECQEVVAPGVNGEIGLLPGHVPLVTTLRPGVLTVFKEGKKSVYAVSTGYAEIEQDKVTILTDACEAQGSIDVERARRALSESEKKLESLSPDEADYRTQQRRIQRATARLDAAERR
jgi:F-type H+-transporting ATPase subunit epsilon